MAVEVEASGQVDEFLRILKRRIWWIVVPTVVIGSLGTFFAVVVPKKYVSRTEVMVGNPQSVGVATAKSSDFEGKVATFSLRAPTRIDSVLNDLPWTDYKRLTAPERQEYIQDLLSNLKVSLPTMPQDSGKQLVEISYKDTSPERARLFLTQLFKSWKDEVLQGQLQREKNAERETKEKLGDLTRELQLVLEEQKAIRAEYDISPPRPGADGRPLQPLSPVFDEQKQVERDIGDLEEQLEVGEGKLDLAKKEHDRMPPEAPPEAGAGGDPVAQQIQKVDEMIQSLERLILTNSWSAQHSEYKRTEERIEQARQLRRQLEAERANASRTEPGGMVENPERRARWQAIQREQDRLDSIRATISRKRIRLEELEDQTFRLNSAHSKLEQLGAEATSLRAEIETLRLRANDHEIRVATLETPAGNPFEVQLQPTVPLEPTDPNPWIIAIGAIIFGLGLGLGLAVLKEYSRSVFRSPRELSRVMTHPVLGTVNTIRTRRERARALLVRSILGGGSLLFLLSVGYVTWAWAMNKDALTDSLVDAIDRFRELLM